MSTDESSDFFLDQAFRSATAVRSEGETGLVPAGKILLAGQLDRFFAEGKKVFPDADSFKFDYSPFYTASRTAAGNLRRIAGDYDTIIYCLANPNSFQVLESLKNVETNIIVFSVLTPVYLDNLDWIKNALAVYGISRESFQAGFGVLSGKITPRGILPIKFNKEKN
jgi:beta-N-acetylhexosaminidase